MIPGRSVIQALMSFPGGKGSVSENSVPKLFFLMPCDSISERTFPVFVDFPGIVDRSPCARASALLMRSPEGLIDPDRASIKLPFPAPHHLSSLLSLT